MKSLCVFLTVFLFSLMVVAQDKPAVAAQDKPVEVAQDKAVEPEKAQPVEEKSKDAAVVEELAKQLEELKKNNEKRDAEVESLKKELGDLKKAKAEIKATETKEPVKEPVKIQDVIKFKPYGFFELYGYANDAQFMSNDLMIYVKDEDKSTGNINARNTRLGLDITLPSVTAVDLSAKLEIDFFGALADSGSAEPSVGLRMRHGFFKVAKTFKSNTTLALVAGQTWATAVIPIFPSVINPAVGWGTGNLWNRLPLAELEVAQKAGPVDIGLKFAAVKPISGASSNRKGFLEVNVDSGDSSHWPSLQGQLYLKAKFAGLDLLVAGGGAYGREDYTGGIKINNGTDPVFGDEVEVWMVNAALKLTHQYAEIQAKYFIGENLDMFGFFGGSVIKDADGYVVDSMRGMGYWGELSIKPVKGLKLSVGLGREHADHDQSAYDLNSSLWVSVFYTMFDHFTPGFQWQQIKTEKNDVELTGNAFVGNLKFTF